MLYFRCKEAIMLWIFCKVGALGSVCAVLNIALPYQSILLFKCLFVSMLSAGVRGIRCTLCSISQRNPGSTMAYYHFILHDLWHTVGKQWLKYGHFSNHYSMQKKKELISCKFAFGTLCEVRDAAAASPRCCYRTLPGIGKYACTSPCTLFEQHLLWANRWSSRVLIK